MAWSALTRIGEGVYNAYTGVSASRYWTQTAKAETLYDKMYLPFYNEVNRRGIQRTSFAPMYTAVDNADRTNRELRDDGIDSIWFPITADDTCDCVVFPTIDDSTPITECVTDVYWGMFQLQTTNGNCYDVFFNYADVFANCPSAQSRYQYNEYFSCLVDFTNDPYDPATTDTTSMTDPTEVENSKTMTASPHKIRKEGDGDHKTTRIHLSIHRLLTFVVEAFFALQTPVN